jgi:hypothetical protein
VPALSTIVQKGNIVEWISVKDRLPDTDGDYIGSDGKYSFPITFQAKSSFRNGSLWGWGGESYPEVTHWMSLPPPLRNNQ